jgi:hypothetical protein
MAARIRLLIDVRRDVPMDPETSRCVQLRPEVHAWVAPSAGSDDPGLRGAPPLTNDPSTLTLRGAAPDTLLLANRQRVLQARDTNVAAPAHRLGVECIVVIVREEDARLQPPASTQFPPHDLVGRHDLVPRGESSARSRDPATRESRSGEPLLGRGSLCDFDDDRARWVVRPPATGTTSATAPT